MQVNLRGFTMSLFSKRKKLLAIGCSYTDNVWTKTHKFPVWPELLAEKLNMECVNLGACGAGNDYILAKMLDKVNEQDWDLVVIMWTEFQRLDFESENVWLSLHPHRHGICHDKFSMNLSGRVTLLKYANIYSMTQKIMRMFYMTEKLLKDIPYIMVQGPRSVSTPVGMGFKYSDGYWQIVEEECTESVLKSPYIDKIDENKFLGFPIMRKIGGWNMDDALDLKDPERTTCRISQEDTHPNGKGHDYIAEILYDKYKETYL